MSLQILDDENNNLIIINKHKHEQIAALLLQKLKKSALISGAIFICFFIILSLHYFNIVHIFELQIIRLFCTFGIIAFVIYVLSTFRTAYRYGEQHSALDFKIVDNQAITSNFYRFLYSLAALLLLILGWKLFKTYQPMEWAATGLDDGNMPSLASWWLPYSNLIGILFLFALPFLGLTMITFLCLHTHEKTLSLNNSHDIQAQKLKYLFTYLGILLLAIVSIIIVDNNTSLKSTLSIFARFFKINKDEFLFALFIFFLPLFIAQWAVYVRKPIHI